MYKYRYIYICYIQDYKVIFSKNKTIIYCILTWIAGILFDLPSFLSKLLTIFMLIIIILYIYYKRIKWTVL